MKKTHHDWRGASDAHSKTNLVRLVHPNVYRRRRFSSRKTENISLACHNKLFQILQLNGYVFFSLHFSLSLSRRLSSRCL